jgi:hypothetical protein
MSAAMSLNRARAAADRSVRKLPKFHVQLCGNAGGAPEQMGIKAAPHNG